MGVWIWRDRHGKGVGEIERRDNTRVYFYMWGCRGILFHGTWNIILLMNTRDMLMLNFCRSDKRNNPQLMTNFVLLLLQFQIPNLLLHPLPQMAPSEGGSLGSNRQQPTLSCVHQQRLLLEAKSRQQEESLANGKSSSFYFILRLYFCTNWLSILGLAFIGVLLFLAPPGSS